MLPAPYQTAGEPARSGLLRVALATGGAHVEGRLRRVPESASLWGRKCEPDRSEWVPSGPRIGWVEGGDLYLDPSASYEVAQQAAGVERFVVSPARNPLRISAFRSNRNAGPPCIGPSGCLKIHDGALRSEDPARYHPQP